MRSRNSVTAALLILTAGCAKPAEPPGATANSGETLIAVDTSGDRSYRTGMNDGIFSLAGSCLVLSVPNLGDFTPVFFTRPAIATGDDAQSKGSGAIPLGRRVTVAGAPVAEGARGPTVAADVREQCARRYFVVGYVETGEPDAVPKAPPPPPPPETR
jgi:hypothetical protein